jgi:nucleoside-diphosphate-sugar epimerase
MKLVVYGATGVIGRAVAEHFAGIPEWETVGVSRRAVDVAGVQHVPLDLLDRAACTAAARSPQLAGATHVVFAALQESADLVGGWRDRDVMDRNLAMFANALEPLLDATGDSLEHASLLQGAKAYGLHLGRSPVPAKERAPRDDHANFYFLQEDRLRELAAGAEWSWTILRPQVVYGQSFGSPMNLVPVLGVYGAFLRERGLPLSFPGGPAHLQEAVDARLLARALAWAATAPSARGETFNVTNGDVFAWPDVWPTVADALGMEVGDPTPMRLAESMPSRAGEWADVVDRYRLRSPRDLRAFVGGSWSYADIMFGSLGAPRTLPAVLSTVKIRQAGFGDCVDTEDMLRGWLELFQQRRLLPPR